MKLQSLAIMFIVIILPISMVLASYTEVKVDTLSLQNEYDVKLDNATADAISAFQINTYNGDESIFANYKMEDIEAAVSTFYNAMRTSFSMGGYNNKSIEEFIPALVFTLYDGYYIYSPYQNTWDNETITKTEQFEDNGGVPSYNGGTSTDSGRESLFGLKPYVYYSCRYERGNTDVVITYSLDNYISIKGVSGDEPINISGYLLSDVELNNNVITYRGNAISTETLRENVMDDNQIKNLPCRKVNGTKYYYDDFITLPLLLCAINELGYNFYIYIARFLVRNRLDLGYYFVNIMVPELLFSLIVTLFVYRIFLKANKKLDRMEEKRGQNVA